MVYVSGDIPGKGMYICDFCGSSVNLGDTDKLTPCSKCGKLEYNK
jgi:DNA-directed RNA polymerase subunit RPC12/RpoP